MTRALLSPSHAAATGCLALALQACSVTTTVQPLSAESAVITPVPAAGQWVVLERGLERGSVVRYAEPGESGRLLYAVRNRWSQDIGLIDAMGRAWRRVPHGEDRWLGTGTVLDGTRRILDLDESTRLVPVEAAGPRDAEIAPSQPPEPPPKEGAER